jgi:hypothetical protein
MKTFAQPSSNLCGTLFSPSLVAQLLSAERERALSRFPAGCQRVVSGCTTGAPDRHFCLRRGGLIRYEDIRADTPEPPRALSATGHWRQIEFSVRSACALRADSVRSRPSVFASSRGIRST